MLQTSVMIRYLLPVLAIAITPFLAHSASLVDENFEHFSTGFPLTGAHNRVDCQTCHQGSIFKGTPMLCSGCHVRAGRIDASAKPVNHILSTKACDSCHNTYDWKSAIRIDHAEVLGRCVKCHNGSVALGKNRNHVTSNDLCEDCHNTLAWSNAHYDHSGITARCSSCHNRIIATGKSNNHVTTQEECDLCHSTRAWTPAGFDHSNVTEPCSNCHNGSTATGIGRNHFITSQQCDYCHTAGGSWGTIVFRHTSGNYPGDHRGNLSCASCHTSNNEVISWRYTAYKPDCAGCHAGDYKSGEGPHRSLSQDRDCGRSGCHRVSDRNWD